MSRAMTDGVPVRAQNLARLRRRRSRGVLREVTALILVLGPGAALAQPFINQFELKTLESEPGGFEFQSQNAWSWGHPARRIEGDDANGFVVDENSITRERYALEVEAGFTHVLKGRIGIEFERERLDSPATIAQANDFDELTLSEVGAELIAILVPRDEDGTGLGLVAEIEGPLDQEEPNTLTLGAIVEFRAGRWFVAGVPMLVRAFGGETEDDAQVDDKWDFAYALQLKYEFSASWSLALEGYGTVERIGNTGHPSEAAALFGNVQQHRAGPVLYYSYSSVAVGVGWLEGLNDTTSDHTLKLSIEVQF
jgi:hypothetical protein